MKLVSLFFQNGLSQYKILIYITTVNHKVEDKVWNTDSWTNKINSQQHFENNFQGNLLQQISFISESSFVTKFLIKIAVCLFL